MRSGRKEMNVCTDLNISQWEHIMHHQLIPIEEVGIYKNAIHTSSEGTNTHLTLSRAKAISTVHMLCIISVARCRKT